MPDVMNFDPSDKNPTIVDRLIRAPGVIIGAALVLGVLGLAVLVVLWMLLGDPIRALLDSQLAFSTYTGAWVESENFGSNTTRLGWGK